MRVSDVVFLWSDLVVFVSNEIGIDLIVFCEFWVVLIKSSFNYVELVDIG